MKSLRIIFFSTLFVVLLAGCAQVSSTETTGVSTNTIATEETAAPTAEIITETAQPTEENTQQYEPVDVSVCKLIQEEAAQALGVEFTLEIPAPFEDSIAGESGQGCRLTANGNGNDFESASAVVQELVKSAGTGWYEQINYQADGPTGSSTAMARDMALMILTAQWEPETVATCPADQPISSCDLTPEQRIYTIQIDIAQYKADFSLGGFWEDPSTNFSLNLYQEWKHIYGNHTTVAQNGNKIDSLEVSIDGYLKGKTVDVEFQSSFTEDTGTAQITYVDVNTITWKIINPPEGEYYFPPEATLTRK